MEKNTTSKGLFEIKIPASAESKILSKINHLLTDKEELMTEIDKNIHHLSIEQLEYLKSLLHLETTVFAHDKLNEKLVGDPLFFYVCRYNLYEGLLKTMKQIEEINHDNVIFQIGLPERNWLALRSSTNSEITNIELLEINMYPEVTGVEESGIEINIYDSKGYNDEIEKSLREYYKSQGRTDEQIQFWLEENRQKREVTKIVSSAILDDWKISDFEDNVSYDEKVKGKRFSWVTVYKKDLYD